MRDRWGETAHGLVVVHTHTDAGDVLSLVGELDLASSPRFVTQSAQALRRGAKRILLDLDGVTLVDSSGLASLLNVLRRATAAEAQLVLVGVQPQVRRVFDQTRLDREFTFAATVADARRL